MRVLVTGASGFIGSHLCAARYSQRACAEKALAVYQQALAFHEKT